MYQGDRRLFALEQYPLYFALQVNGAAYAGMSSRMQTGWQSFHVDTLCTITCATSASCSMQTQLVLDEYTVHMASLAKYILRSQ